MNEAIPHDALPRIRGLLVQGACRWKLLQRSDTDPCFEPCRVPALKPRQRVRGNTIAGFQSESNLAGQSGPKYGNTVDPGLEAVKGKLRRRGVLTGRLERP